MAKDPAVLFYTSDFLVGTALMDDAEVGRYIKLLCLQHQKGRLTEKQFFSMARKEDVDLMEKFLVDDCGFYYNERMEKESNKRKRFTESRRKNAQGKASAKASARHTDKRTENENEIINEDINLNANSEKQKKPKKHKYGEYQHVLLTEIEYLRLLSEWGKDKLSSMISKLDEGIQLKGYKYKDHNLALRKWAKNDPDEAAAEPKREFMEVKF